MIALAAALLAGASAAVYFYYRGQLGLIVGTRLRLVVTGPSTVRAKTAAEYMVSTTMIDGRPLRAQIEATILTPDGKRLKTYRESADDRGRLLLLIPADLQLPPRIKLGMTASLGDAHAEVELPLAAEPDGFATRVTLDRSVYQPGDTVYYRSLTLARVTSTAADDMTVRFRVLDSKGAPVPESAFSVRTDHGIGEGRFAISKDLADGKYTLAVSSADQAFSDQSQPFFVRRKVSAKSEPAHSPKIEVDFHPEGGSLAKGLESRVYFVARDALGSPVELSGVVFGSVAGQREQEGPVAEVQTSVDGIGAFNLAPQDGVKYRLKITSPAGIKDEPALPATTNHDVILATGTGVFDAEKPLEFNIRSAKAGVPLVVAAYCQGVQVGQQLLVTHGASAAVPNNGRNANPAAISIPSNISGVLRLSVYDYSASPPTCVAERLVYRRPAQQLNVQVLEWKKRYSPDEPATLSFAVTDQNGAAAPLALSVAVTAIDERTPVESLLAAAGQSVIPCAAPNELSAKTQDTLSARADRAAGGFMLGNHYLFDRENDDVPASVALDLLLGAQSGPPTAEKAPAMFDNLAQLRADYQQLLADYQSAHARAVDTIITASFFGGVGLILLVTMLGLMRILSGMSLWVAGVAAVISTTLIGAVLADAASRQTTGQDLPVAFSSYHATEKSGASKEKTNESASPIKETVTGADLAKPQTGSPETPYWNPLLLASSYGKATIDFRLPKDAGKYRLTVEAHGQGMIGAGQAEITVTTAP